MTATQQHRDAAADLTPWVAQLGAQAFDVRQHAAAFVCGHNTATRTALMQGTRHADARIRAGSVALLALIGEPSILPTVSVCLRDSAVSVRRAALHGLSKLAADPSASEKAVTYSYCFVAENDTSPTVRNAALHALGSRPYDADAHQLLARLAPTLTHPRLHRSAIWSLAQQTRKQNAPQETGMAAATSAPAVPLADLTTEALVELLGHALPRVRAEASHVLFARGADTLDALVRAFDHPNVHVRRACVDLMDHLADENCLAPLARALHDADAGVRRSALHSLTCQVCKPTPLQGDRITPLLERALTDTDARVRQVATNALAPFTDDPRVQAALQTLAQSGKDTVTRRRAAVALASV